MRFLKDCQKVVTKIYYVWAPSSLKSGFVGLMNVVLQASLSFSAINKWKLELRSVPTVYFLSSKVCWYPSANWIKPNKVQLHWIEEESLAFYFSCVLNWI